MYCWTNPTLYLDPARARAGSNSYVGRFRPSEHYKKCSSSVFTYCIAVPFRKKKSSDNSFEIERTFKKMYARAIAQEFKSSRILFNPTIHDII